MLIFSIAWVFLAVTVTLVAMQTRSRAAGLNPADAETKESGRGVALLASIYGLALLAGFFYVARFLVSNL